MQISASTLLASQQVGPTPAKPAAAGFTQALEKSTGFQPLAFKQTTPAPAPSVAEPAPKGLSRPGSAVDIKV